MITKVFFKLGSHQLTKTFNVNTFFHGNYFSNVSQHQNVKINFCLKLESRIIFAKKPPYRKAKKMFVFLTN